MSPNQREAESLVGQEFSDDADFLMALDTIADLGARNVLITQETSCFALVREERTVRRFRASIERIEPVASVGAGDVLLAGLPRRPVQRPAHRRRAAQRGRLRRRIGARGRARAASTRARRAASRPTSKLEELAPVSA